jgi:hypothetical protein
MNMVSKLPVDFRTKLPTQGMLTLELAGPFGLRDAAGNDLTPRCRKAQGLLALVATSRNLRRGRAWLQDKLWSDRGPEQGAASLRQCLTGIRAALGSHVDALRTDGGWVSLDPQRVRIVTDAPDGDEEVEFLEGLDIRDPEFEHWLRDQRLHFFERAQARDDREAIEADEVPAPLAGGDTSAAQRPAIGITSHRISEAGDGGDELSDFVLDLVAGILLKQASVVVIDDRRQEGRARQSARPFWRLRVTSSRRADRLRVSMMLSEASSERVLWTDATTFDSADLYASEPAAIGALARGATACLAGAGGRPQA